MTCQLGHAERRSPRCSPADPSDRGYVPVTVANGTASMSQLRLSGTIAFVGLAVAPPQVDSSAIDYEKAEADLCDYMRHVSECQKLPVLTKERRAALKILNIEAIRVNRILASLTPDHASISGSSLANHQAAVPVVQRAQALIVDSYLILESRNDLDETVVALRMLHPLVYTPARAHWETG